MTMFNPPHAGMLIKDVIETQGRTVYELSCALKVSVSTATKILSGKLCISQELAFKIEKVLNIDAQLLLDILNAHTLYLNKKVENFE